MIQRLDHYVWEEVASQIRDWRNRFGLSIPVSVNVSRVDMADPDIVKDFQKLLEEYSLEPEDLILEITESAYSEDEGFIISTVNTLRGLGLRVEMDDFGTGYSSLGMISQMPIDALKLDMIFVRNAFAGHGDMKMIELIIDIAGYLRVPVIAEGVETKEQVDVLKYMGCDIIQGYYFSKPVPAEEFERFVSEKKQMLIDEARRAESDDHEVLAQAEASMNDTMTYARISQALAQDYFAIYYISMITGAYIEYSMKNEDHRLLPINNGERFFEDCMKNIRERVIPSDRDRVIAAFNERNLMRVIKNNRKFQINFQMLDNGDPMHVSIKAIRLPDDDDHFLIGMTNIDEQMEMEKAYRDAQDKSINYSGLAQALAADYFCIYYIDMETDDFFEFTAHDSYEDMGVEKEGKDFFTLTRKNILRLIYKEDQKYFLDVFTKENILRKIRENGSFIATYRLMFDGVPTYVSLKAIPMKGNDKRYIVIGVNNIDKQMKRREEYELSQKENLSYSRFVQTIAKDYYSIYMVNLDTDDFTEYSLNPEYKELKVEQSGVDFFESYRKNLVRLVHPDDLKRALMVWEKGQIQNELSKGESFSVTYRLMFEGSAEYINCKVIRMTGEDEGNILIAISNVDEQIRREQEYENDLRKARSASLRDPLTGVRSKLAFTEEEKKIDDMIAEDQQEPFAVAVCDVNGLKEINNTKGHKAGDQIIVEACRMICNQFKHSPVFRIGGDEFVAILQRADYRERESLIEDFIKHNADNACGDGVVIACGVADWREGLKESFEAVFERADERMHENKNSLKTTAEE